MNIGSKLSNFVRELCFGEDIKFSSFPPLKKILVIIAFVFIVVVYIADEYVLPYCADKSPELLPHLPQIKALSFILVIIASVLVIISIQKTVYRLIFTFFIFIAMFGIFTEAPKAWIQAVPRQIRVILFISSISGPLIIFIILLRRHLQTKKGLQMPTAGTLSWGINLKLRSKYIFELINLFFALVYCSLIVPVLGTQFLTSTSNRLLGGSVIFLSTFLIFNTGIYINTRYIFRGLLLPPWIAKGFFFKITLVFYSLVLISIVNRVMSNLQPDYPKKHIVYVLSIVFVLLSFFVSYMGMEYVSRRAKGALEASWRRTP